MPVDPMPERELAESAAEAWASLGWSVASELPVAIPEGNRIHHRTPDLVLSKDELVCAVEAKLRLTHEVLVQAQFWREIADFAVVLVGHPKRVTTAHERFLSMARTMGIGVTYVGPTGLTVRVPGRQQSRPRRGPLLDALAAAAANPGRVPAGSRGGLRMTSDQRRWNPVRELLRRATHSMTAAEIAADLAADGELCGFRDRRMLRLEFLKAADRGVLGIARDDLATPYTFESSETDLVGCGSDAGGTDTTQSMTPGGHDEA